jgi:hypothetical protein
LNDGDFIYNLVEIQAVKGDITTKSIILTIVTFPLVFSVHFLTVLFFPLVFLIMSIKEEDDFNCIDLDIEDKEMKILYEKVFEKVNKQFSLLVKINLFLLSLFLFLIFALIHFNRDILYISLLLFTLFILNNIEIMFMIGFKTYLIQLLELYIRTD